MTMPSKDEQEILRKAARDRADIVAKYDLVSKLDNKFAKLVFILNEEDRGSKFYQIKL